MNAIVFSKQQGAGFATQYRDRIVGAMQGAGFATLGGRFLSVAYRDRIVGAMQGAGFATLGGRFLSVAVSRPNCGSDARSVFCDPLRTYFVCRSPEERSLRRSIANVYTVSSGFHCFVSACPEHSEGMRDRIVGAMQGTNLQRLRAPAVLYERRRSICGSDVEIDWIIPVKGKIN